MSERTSSDCTLSSISSGGSSSGSEGYKSGDHEPGVDALQEFAAQVRRLQRRATSGGSAPTLHSIAKLIPGLISLCETTSESSVSCDFYSYFPFLISDHPSQ